MSHETPPPAVPKKRTVSGLTFVLVAAILAIGAGFYYYVRQQNETPPVDEFNSLKGYFGLLGRNQNLAGEFVDANGDLIADPPADPGKFLSVKEISFCAVGTDDEERLKREEAEWAPLMAAIAKSTGLPVKYSKDVKGVSDQMGALKSGTLHVTAFNTGAVTEAVNSAGFVPLFSPAGDDGKFGIRAEILVKNSSSIQKPEDLKGKTIAFVSLSSNSGAKLPMAMLKEKHNLLPARDYKYRITGDHYASLVALAETDDFDAVCVASDIKDTALAGFKFRGKDKKLNAAELRTVFASDPVPPLCFGVPHNLPADVKSKIEAAFRDYRFASPKPGKARFAAVNYKDDWKIVREIDVTLSRLADQP